LVHNIISHAAGWVASTSTFGKEDNMKLSIEGKEVEATRDLIHKVVHDQDFRGDFFILIRDEAENAFIQATGPNKALHVEHCKGGADDEILVCSEPVSCLDLEELCLAYLTGDPQALEKYGWHSLEDFKPSEGASGEASWTISGL
jgi:hypothetical protein